MGKVSNIIEKEFNSEPVHNKKYLNAKKKLIPKKINAKEGSQYIYISVILNASFYIKDENYYAQALSNKYKYVVRGKKNVKFPMISDDLDFDEKVAMKKFRYINLFLKEIRIIR